MLPNISFFRYSNYLLLIFFTISCTGCYTFKSTGIPPEINTYYISTFQNNALDAPATYSLLLADDLRNKIRTESRLQNIDTDPDVEFLGTIKNFHVSSQAPTENETTAFNRLDVVVTIEFINHKNEEKNWVKDFDYLVDFGSDENFLNVQDELITEVNKNLVENIFNAAFSDW